MIQRYFWPFKATQCCIIMQSHQKLVELTRIMATCEKRSYVWQMYDKPVSSSKIFCRMNVATCRTNHDFVYYSQKTEFMHILFLKREYRFSDTGVSLNATRQKSIPFSTTSQEQTVFDNVTILFLKTSQERTVFDNSLPASMIRRQSGMISVVNRKLMTSCSSV